MSIERLKELQQSMAVKHTFKPGDEVVWKAGLRNRRIPEYGERALVAELRDTPLYEQGADCGTSFFGEPLDFVLAHLDSDGDLIHHHVDSRRFEPAE